MATGIRVTAKTDSKEWSAAIARIAVLLKPATADASLDAASLVESLTKAKLTQLEHGPLTFSPSPRGAGMPPAMVSGDLAASIDHASDGATGAIVGPTGGYGRTAFYARIQELGGTMEGHPIMQFKKLGSDGAIHKFRRRIVVLTARPYLKPATEDAVDSGRVRDIYAEWWGRAIEAGAG